MRKFFTMFGLIAFIDAIVVLINYLQFKELHFSIVNSIMVVIICIIFYNMLDKRADQVYNVVKLKQRDGGF